MDLKIAGTNIEITADVRNYVERKLGKLKRHSNNIMDCKIEISEEQTKSPQQHFLVRATVDSSGAVFHGEERGQDLFTAIDKVSAIMTRQLENHKGKLYDKGRGTSLARGKFNIEAREPSADRKLVKTKRFIIKAMALEESIEHMESLGHDFFLFLDADTQELRLLYRRKDGNYGLIEPELE